MPLSIEPMEISDFSQVLPFVEKIIRQGCTYALDRYMENDAIQAYFFRPKNQVFRAVWDGKVVGAYYLRPNQDGGGSHVANAGFMVCESARGKGVARTMATHALNTAKEQGFEAMQFNFVLETNEGAVALWQKMGFDVLGVIPKAFDHPHLGKSNALIMHKVL